jgi:hypothetical protein
MSKSDIAQPFTVDEISFRACFTAPSLELFTAMVVGWVLTVGRHTISNVILTMGLHESRHFASVYRFVGRGRWLADMVSCIVYERLVETLIPRGAEVLLVVDDTLNKHRGKKICGAGWQHDGSAVGDKKRKGYGLCFVIIGLAVRLEGIADRVFCLPYAARLWWPPRTKVKPATMAYKTKPQLAVELIELTRSWTAEGRQIRVVTDSGYTCDTVINGRPPGTEITGRISRRSALYELPPEASQRGRGRPRKKGRRMPAPEALFQDRTLPWEEMSTGSGRKERVRQVCTFPAIWYHAVGNVPLKVVLSHDLSGTYTDTVFVDTDLSATPTEVIRRYEGRSSIEVTHHETKELLGAADPQCRSEQSAVRSPLFAYWAYSLVVLWFVCHCKTARGLVVAPGPWYRQKKCCSFSDMLAAARRSHFKVRFMKEPSEHATLPKFNVARSARQTKYAETAKL